MEVNYHGFRRDLRGDLLKAASTLASRRWATRAATNLSKGCRHLLRRSDNNHLRPQVMFVRSKWAGIGAGGPQSHRLEVSRGRRTCGVLRRGGQGPEARSALAEAMKLNPKLSVAWLDAHVPSYTGSAAEHA